MVKIDRVETDEKLCEVAELAEMIWHEFFPVILSEEQIDYMVEKFQSYEAMKEQVANQDYCYFSVSDNDGMCGYIAVKPEKDSRFFLSKLYLRSDRRGKGIASEMLSRVFSEAEKAGKTSIYLTVNKYNSHAVDVYGKKGFEIIDSVVTDIGNGFVMDDYIMEYRL
ncbi:MAG: GNAT family N-acetyltransferase [Ruminococcus sp.]|nr:GNAT family N-acetyltransferase [Ruminococcus sp.]MDE6849535.1 GNAT family N-acetyltransferase [Ruminococcus sp.]